ncbi:MAG: SLBB domain-containing protein, partial [Candidatus Delongbacteria bacterium]
MRIKSLKIPGYLIKAILFFTFYLYAQEGDFIESEMIKIQEEFRTDRIEPSAELEQDSQDPAEINQDALIEELMKPGNEGLLEQIRESGRMEVLEDIDGKLTEKKTEEELAREKEEQERLNQEEKEEEERKLKAARASLDGLLFEDNYAYYQSIKDFYGYDIFLRVATKSSESALLSNDEYVVGPGDELVLTLWGDTEFQRFLRVNDDGTIYTRELGIVNVNGYKVSELYDRLKRILSRKYATINPPNGEPTTFYDISIRKLKSITVSVNGEVVVPGSYTVSHNSTILDVLKQAKGVTAKGTLRDIVLIRGSKKLLHFDVYDYLMTGKTVEDVTLKEGDNIFVGPRKGTVELTGEVLKPLKYELKRNEDLSHLIKYSGGLLPTAAIDQISIERIMPFENRTGPVVTTKIYDHDFTYLSDGKVKVVPVKLFNHDVVKVFQVPKLLTDYVAIGGAVYRKGKYSFKDG